MGLVDVPNYKGNAFIFIQNTMKISCNDKQYHELKMG